MLSKREVAELLLDRILIRLDSRESAQEPAVEPAVQEPPALVEAREVGEAPELATAGPETAS